MSNSLRSEVSLDEKESSLVESQPTPATPDKIVWYRSTWYASIILGLCNFAAPGIWGAMNSLGAGGQATPFLVNGTSVYCTLPPSLRELTISFYLSLQCPHLRLDGHHGLLDFDHHALHRSSVDAVFRRRRIRPLRSVSDLGAFLLCGARVDTPFLAAACTAITASATSGSSCSARRCAASRRVPSGASRLPWP